MSAMQSGLISRRLFLVRSAQAGAGLTLAMALPGGAGAEQVAGDLEANAFVTVTADNRVVVTIKHLEMGQGTYTGLATLVAEELDADWDQVEAVGAPANTRKFANTQMGLQLTGGSTAIANSYLQMREAGAAARVMLLAAASKAWQVPVSSLSTEKGKVIHVASGRSARYGDLAAAAAGESLPETLTLKEPANFKLIGASNLARKDTGKTDGSGQFTQDVNLPGMLTAVVAHPPRFGASLSSVVADKAKAIPGVKAVVQIPSGVAVLADGFWQAKKGRDALELQWQGGMDRGSDEILADYHNIAARPGSSAVNRGDVGGALDAADDVLSLEYRFPYLPHATMEPMNCVMQKTATGAELWYGCQGHTWDQANVAKVLGVAPEKVKINTLYAGGSFGRRATTNSDYPCELAEIVKAWGGEAPVKLVWTREDDTCGGYYRPAYVHRIDAALDGSGKPVVWRQRIVGQSILGLAADKVDHTTVEGASNLPYNIRNFAVETNNTDESVPISWWRSVGSTHTAYAVETMIDVLARKAGQDPVSYRLALLEGEPRHMGVLKLAAEKARWGKGLPEGHFHGVALHKSFGTYVAQVAEVARQQDGKFKVVKVTCAVDCGLAVNPDVIRAQVEGGIGFGLSPLMFNEVTLEKGMAKQRNFDQMKVLRMGQMPQVEVHIVPSAEAPTGIGEPATPVVAPAVANALFAATGTRLTQLPLGDAYFSA